MTVEEFAQLAAAIKTYFPRDNMLPTKKAMELWYDMLKDMDYENAYIGLKNHVATSRFAPTIADIRNGAAITQPQELNEMEAWALVYKAICNGTYNSVEEFSKLPPLVQKAVGLPDNLREWAMTENLNNEVVSSNFMRNYKAVVLREQEILKFSPFVKELVQNTAQGSYSAQIDDLRVRTIKSLSDRKESEIEAIEERSEGVQMPDRVREKYEIWKEGVMNE